MDEAERRKLHGLEQAQEDSQGSDRFDTFTWRNEQLLRDEFQRITQQNIGQSLTFPDWENDGIPTTFQAILGLWNDDSVQKDAIIYSQMDLHVKSQPVLQTEEIRASGAIADFETENALLSMLDFDDYSDDKDEFFKEEDGDIDLILAEIQTPVLVNNIAEELYSPQTPIRKSPNQTRMLDKGSLSAYYNISNTSDDSSFEGSSSKYQISQLDGSVDEDLDAEDLDFPIVQIIDPKTISSTFLVRDPSNCTDDESEVIYTEPFFSNQNDLPKNINNHGLKNNLYKNSLWEFKNKPPSVDKLKIWKRTFTNNTLKRNISFLEGPTQNSQKGIKRSQTLSEKVEHRKNYLTLLSLEVHGMIMGF